MCSRLPNLDVCTICGIFSSLFLFYEMLVVRRSVTFQTRFVIAAFDWIFKFDVKVVLRLGPASFCVALIHLD